MFGRQKREKSAVAEIPGQDSVTNDEQQFF